MVCKLSFSAQLSILIPYLHFEMFLPLMSAEKMFLLLPALYLLAHPPLYFLPVTRDETVSTSP